MATIFEVFDPAMCCSTGICGPEVDPKLVHFSADLDWLKHQNVDVRRYNLAHQPAEFARQVAIKDLLTKAGTQALPAIVVNGTLASQGRYPSRVELAAFAGIAVQKGQSPTSTLTAQTRELIALGASVGANCESCFEFHRAKLTGMGVSAEEISAATEVAQQVKAAAEDNRVQLVPTRASDKDTGGSACCGSGTAAVQVAVKAKVKSTHSCCGG